MNIYRSQLEDVVRACRVELPRDFTWLGMPQGALPKHFRALPAADVRTFLRIAIRERLYMDAYTPGSPRPPRTQEDFTPSTQTHSLMDALAAANAASGCWEPGWTVFDVEEGQYGVDSGTLKLWVAPRDLRAGRSDIHIGDKVSILMPKGSRELSPGYYSAFSDAPSTEMGAQGLVRVYFALTPSGAPIAMKTLTESLNVGCIPFRLKMLADTASYGRADSAVLYLSADCLSDAATYLIPAFHELAPTLRNAAPLFTRPLATGIALAEEPTAEDSFGQHRCDLIARGLITAAEHGCLADPDRVLHVLRAWEAAGIDIERPYLNAGSDDSRYDCLDFGASPVGNTSSAADFLARYTSDTVATATKGAHNGQVRALALEVATSIGERLVAEAVWFEDRCTWLGSIPTTDDHGRPTLAQGAVGRSLYDGSAGVALFLAFLGAVTGSPSARATAVGAARHSIGQTTSASRSSGKGNGLYIGAAGQALAAVTIGVLTKNQDIVRAALEEIVEIPANADEADLLSGSAGTVLALLTLGELVGDDRITSAATTHGNRLLSTAHRSRHGWSWASPGSPTSRPLTGLSHGAGGIGAAFTELAAATGNERYAAAALGAIAYEHNWFDAQVGNWADLRDRPRRTSRSTPHVFRTQWCHGAPGLALARMRAAEVFNEPSLREEAKVAFSTTQRGTNQAFATGSLSFSLCHGLAGNAEILLEGLPIMSHRDAVEAKTLLDAISLCGYQRHIRGTIPWPCGVPVADLEVPGLLLGLAGIGYHYLRTAFELPSLLLLRPDSYGNQVRALVCSDPIPSPANAIGG